MYLKYLIGITRAIFPSLNMYFQVILICADTYYPTLSRTKLLLTNLNNKLLNFTMNDYCIILLSDHDKKDSNCIELINIIGNLIKHIYYTNLITCTPTYYVLGAPIHNYKIELFNSLLS